MEIRNLADIKSLLFDNRTVKQTIFKNSFWIALSSGVSKFLKLVLLIYVARIFGATEYGKFTFALAFISLFVVFSDLGLSRIVTREFSRQRCKEEEEDFYSIISLKIVLGLGALILILIGSFFITSDPDIRKVIWILALFNSISNFSEIIYAFFRARQRMEYISLSMILEALIVFGAGFFIIFKFPSIISLSYGYLLSTLVSLAFILVFFHFKVLHLKVFWKKKIWKDFLRISWPLALVSMCSSVYVYIDSVMMGHIGLITETGWYNAAYKIVFATMVLMGVIDSSFYPVLSKFFKESKKEFQKVWIYQMELMIMLAVPVTVGGFVLAPKIIKFLYGDSFAPSVLAFRILMIMAGIFYISRPFEQVLIVSDNQKKFFWATALGALTNIILNLILIPRFSLYGAAVATVLTYVLILFLFIILTSEFASIRPLNFKIFSSSTIICFSSILMYFVVSQPKIYNLNIFFSIPLGILFYFLLFFSLKFGVKKITAVLNY